MVEMEGYIESSIEGRWTFLSGSKNSNRRYGCSAHDNCQAYLRAKVNKDGNTWTVMSYGVNHSNKTSRTGLHPMVVKFIRNNMYGDDPNGPIMKPKTMHERLMRMVDKQEAIPEGSGLKMEHLIMLQITPSKVQNVMRKTRPKTFTSADLDNKIKNKISTNVNPNNTDEIVLLGRREITEQMGQPLPPVPAPSVALPQAIQPSQQQQQPQTSSAEPQQQQQQSQPQTQEDQQQLPSQPVSTEPPHATQQQTPQTPFDLPSVTEVPSQIPPPQLPELPSQLPQLPPLPSQLQIPGHGVPVSGTQPMPSVGASETLAGATVPIVQSTRNGQPLIGTGITQNPTVISMRAPPAVSDVIYVFSCIKMLEDLKGKDLSNNLVASVSWVEGIIKGTSPNGKKFSVITLGRLGENGLLIPCAFGLTTNICPDSIHAFLEIIRTNAIVRLPQLPSCVVMDANAEIRKTVSALDVKVPICLSHINSLLQPMSAREFAAADHPDPESVKTRVLKDFDFLFSVRSPAMFQYTLRLLFDRLKEYASQSFVDSIHSYFMMLNDYPPSYLPDGYNRICAASENFDAVLKRDHFTKPVSFNEFIDNLPRLTRIFCNNSNPPAVFGNNIISEEMWIKADRRSKTFRKRPKTLYVGILPPSAMIRIQTECFITASDERGELRDIANDEEGVYRAINVFFAPTSLRDRPDWNDIQDIHKRWHFVVPAARNGQGLCNCAHFLASGTCYHYLAIALKQQTQSLPQVIADKIANRGNVPLTMPVLPPMPAMMATVQPTIQQQQQQQQHMMPPNMVPRQVMMGSAPPLPQMPQMPQLPQFQTHLLQQQHHHHQEQQQHNNNNNNNLDNLNLNNLLILQALNLN
eukprot:TRINITY_DN704_c0_g1_i5.p1 TRINITY_DN704_c0_g1~~TRINITY_DN704_c0_g1_i5.p1  ORF type:complete len:971 (-),score=349.44 TRINITY_DN704_c0_g1_i5:151-2733(-)